MKLNQLIAVMQSVKKRAADEKTKIYKQIQKPELFQGLSRTYSPKDEEGHVYPPESQKVTYKAAEALEAFSRACQDLFDSALTQDEANTSARANITLDDGTVVASDVPVTYLMFLDKQLTDIRTFLSHIPTLPIDEDWEYDPNRGFYVTRPRETTKTKKVQEFVIAAEATEHHPAQVKEVTNDVVEGTWSLVKFSGALPQSELDEMRLRLDVLQKAVIKAREEANGGDITRRTISNNIFDYLFGQR